MHGTGTSLGDPVEVGALSAVLLGATKSQNPLALSAVKSCVGHSEAAAGLSGILQLFGPLLMGSHSPLLHLRDVNPLVANVLDTQAEKGGKVVQLPRYSSAQCADVASDVQGVYGVSGFAFQGTNAHVVLTRLGLNLNVRKIEGISVGKRCWMSRRRSVFFANGLLQGNNLMLTQRWTITSFLQIADHQVMGRVVCPGAAYMEMSGCVSEICNGTMGTELKSLVLDASIPMPLTLAKPFETENGLITECELSLLVDREQGDIQIRSSNAAKGALDCISVHPLD